MSSVSIDAAAPPPPAEPYGLAGLVVSLVLIFLATVLLCVLVGAIVFGVACAILGWREIVDRFVDLDPSGAQDRAFAEKLTVLVSPVIYTALAAAVLLAARIRAGARWGDLVGWRPWHPLRGAAWVWMLAVLMLLYSFGADAAMTYLAPHLKDLVHMPKGLKWAVLFVLLASFFAPVAEELLFRGWIYTSLRASFGIPAALLVSSVLFGLAHWESTHLYALAVFPVGLGLGYIRQRTGSIRASMAVHGFYNGVASALLFFAT